MHPANKWLAGLATAGLLTSASLWEGRRHVSYTDLAGVLTVCDGYTGRDIVPGKRYTDQECDILLRKEVLEHANGVLNCISKPLEYHQYAAFTLMAYNVGVAGFCGSRAARLFNEGRTLEACRAIAYTPSGAPTWSFVNGKFVQGLHNRRKFESDMCYGKKNDLLN